VAHIRGIYGTSQGWRSARTDGGPERLTYSVEEVAEVLGLSRSKTYDLVARGEIPVVPLTGRRKLIARVTVERLLCDERPRQSAFGMADLPVRGRTAASAGSAPPVRFVDQLAEHRRGAIVAFGQ
jgi:excisionase family DNA binding protein